MDLKDYQTGTVIQIADRRFEKVQPGSFWKEIHSIPGNCVSRPSVSIEVIEQAAGVTHTVLHYPAEEQNDPITRNGNYAQR